MPEGLPSHIDVSRTYFRRGWTTYEYCSAQLAKNEVQYAQWSLVMDLNNVKGEVKRILPTTPERFAELIATKDFTNDADCGAVGELYGRMASAVLGTIKSWNFIGAPLLLEHGDGEKLADALNLCESLETLNLTASRMTDQGIIGLSSGLARGALPRLQNLVIGYNRFSAHGFRALIQAVVDHDMCPRLRGLSMCYSNLGDDGISYLAGVISKRMKHLILVDVFAADMTNAGAATMARSILQRYHSERLASLATFTWGGNGRLTVAGRACLIGALDRAEISGLWYLSGHSSGGIAMFPMVPGCPGARMCAEDRHGSIARVLWPARMAFVSQIAPPVPFDGVGGVEVSLQGSHKVLRLSKLQLGSSLAPPSGSFGSQTTLLSSVV